MLRVPLAVTFPLVSQPGPALCVLFAAGATDVADGWCARRLGQTTLTGALLDPLMDKVFVGSAVATLVVQGRLPLVAALALVLRDLAEIPLALWLAWDASTHHLALASAAANRSGKMVTVLQFAAIFGAVVGVPHVGVLAVVTSAVGLFAAAIYLRRAL